MVFQHTILFLTKDVILITENEVVTLTSETTLSNESNNKFYAGIILITSIIENIVIENIAFC